MFRNFCRVFVKTRFYALSPYTCSQRGGSLASGGGIGKARTRAKDDVTCSVSYESAPPLAPNRSLREVLFLVLLYIFIPQNYNFSFILQTVPCQSCTKTVDSLHILCKNTHKNSMPHCSRLFFALGREGAIFAKSCVFSEKASVVAGRSE